jgi:hypothetical protein
MQAPVDCSTPWGTTTHGIIALEASGDGEIGLDSLTAQSSDLTSTDPAASAQRHRIYTLMGSGRNLTVQGSVGMLSAP